MPTNRFTRRVYYVALTKNADPRWWRDVTPDRWTEIGFLIRTQCSRGRAKIHSRWLNTTQRSNPPRSLAAISLSCLESSPSVAIFCQSLPLSAVHVCRFEISIDVIPPSSFWTSFSPSIILLYFPCSLEICRNNWLNIYTNVHLLIVKEILSGHPKRPWLTMFPNNSYTNK